MGRYCTVVRSFFAVVFIGGGVSHIIQGRVGADGYAVFGETALWAWLTNLWESFVMLSIGWLTLLLATFEIAVGVCLLLGGRRAKIAVVASLVFFSFILVLSYGFPEANLAEDLLKNRVFTLVMAGLLIPVSAQPDSSQHRCRMASVPWIRWWCAQGWRSAGHRSQAPESLSDDGSEVTYLSTLRGFAVELGFAWPTAVRGQVG